MDNPCYPFYFPIVASNMVVPMLAFTIRVCGSFSLFSSYYLRGPLALVASKWFSPFLNKVIYQNLFVVNYLGLSEMISIQLSHKMIKLHLFEPCSWHSMTNQFNLGVHIWTLTGWCSNRNSVATFSLVSVGDSLASD